MIACKHIIVPHLPVKIYYLKGWGHMTIALTQSPKGGLARLWGRKKTADQSAPAQKLGARDIAKLFTTGRDTLPEKRITPAILNDREQQDIARLSSLRGALYAKD